MGHNSNYNKAKKLYFDKLKMVTKPKLWLNTKTQIVTKLKKKENVMTKNRPMKTMKHSNCDNTRKKYCGKNKKIKLWQN